LSKSVFSFLVLIDNQSQYNAFLYCRPLCSKKGIALGFFLLTKYDVNTFSPIEGFILSKTSNKKNKQEKFKFFFNKKKL
jgi:hypothetical protein